VLDIYLFGYSHLIWTILFIIKAYKSVANSPFQKLLLKYIDFYSFTVSRKSLVASNPSHKHN